MEEEEEEELVVVVVGVRVGAGVCAGGCRRCSATCTRWQLLDNGLGARTCGPPSAQTAPSARHKWKPTRRSRGNCRSRNLQQALRRGAAAEEEVVEVMVVVEE